MKNKILDGEEIELTNGIDCITIWFQERTANFCMMLNGKVIKSCKTWKPIENKLDNIGNIKEVLCG